ncbi:amino acid racemase [Pseudodesulfovibrio cashew]|uniref:Amino acid racemase n=1 Tax=Pseudodesulfovibrio cashew TaxID=2678688 RepID=A0A6I6JCD1_9BACT|nr:aspartate/glutamate racemase family protein [Pseudodesulfovibrio cashew]QGY38710.1 amino acid racemase [Pseudodesulfovibrio cashew]
MKTIGLLGGMSWESSAEYYRVMNRTVQERLGGLHSARILMHSVDFAEYREDMLAGRFDSIGRKLAGIARTLEQGGAELMVIGTNTMHLAAQHVADAVSVPLLHIADATARAAHALGVSRVGLIGTALTMERDFYRARLAENGIESVIPGEADRRLVDRVIFDEMCKGRFLDESRVEFVRVIEALAGQGAGAVILGCTEIGLLVRPGDTAVPLLDTCAIHAAAAVELALR